MIYIDRLKQYGKRHYCHMIAIDESLFAFAKKIGATKYHISNRGIRHYDITPAQRLSAQHFGAKEVSSRELITIWRQHHETIRCNRST